MLTTDGTRASSVLMLRTVDRSASPFVQSSKIGRPKQTAGGDAELLSFEEFHGWGFIRLRAWNFEGGNSVNRIRFDKIIGEYPLATRNI